MTFGTVVIEIQGYRLEPLVCCHIRLLLSFRLIHISCTEVKQLFLGMQNQTFKVLFSSETFVLARFGPVRFVVLDIFIVNVVVIHIFLLTLAGVWLCCQCTTQMAQCLGEKFMMMYVQAASIWCLLYSHRLHIVSSQFVCASVLH